MHAGHYPRLFPLLCQDGELAFFQVSSAISSASFLPEALRFDDCTEHLLSDYALRFHLHGATSPYTTSDTSKPPLPVPRVPNNPPRRSLAPNYVLRPWHINVPIVDGHFSLLDLN